MTNRKSHTRSRLVTNGYMSMLCRIPLRGVEVFHILRDAVSDGNGRFCGNLHRRCDVQCVRSRQQLFSFHLHSDGGGSIRWFTKFEYLSYVRVICMNNANHQTTFSLA